MARREREVRAAQQPLRWYLLAAIVAAIGIGGTWQAPAQKAAPVPNTVITSDRLTFDYNRMVAVFDGNVDARDPEVHMTGERLTVFFEGSNEVKSVTAIGNVRVYHRDRRAECDRAVYIKRLGQVEMTGNAKLYRGRDVVEGDAITFWLDEERMLVEPGTLILYPEEDEGNGTGAASRLRQADPDGGGVVRPSQNQGTQ